MAAGSRDHYYGVLGVDPSATPEDLKRAHRDLVQVWHPDRFTANPRLQKMAQEKLREINEAYAALRLQAPPESSYAPPAETAAPPGPPPARTPRQWFQLGLQAGGVAFAIFALIMGGRGIHSALTERPPAAPAVATLIEPAETDVPPQPARRSSARLTPDYVANGQEIVDPRGATGVGRLTVTNQTDQDAVATLRDHATRTTLRIVYVSAGMQTNIDGIAPGVYHLSLDSGSEFSWSTRGFIRNRTLPRSVGPFAFTQVQTAGQLRGDQYSVVLRRDAAVGSDMSQAGM